MITRLTLAPIPHWRGQWVEGTSYKKDAIIANHGSTFIATIANPTTEPTVTYDAEHNTYTVSAGWGLVAYGSTNELAVIVAEHYAEQLKDAEVVSEHIARVFEELKGFAASADSLGDARAHSFSADKMLMICGEDIILHGEGAPSRIPDFIGQEYCDTAARKSYKAFGNSAVSDWVPLN